MVSFTVLETSFISSVIFFFFQAPVEYQATATNAEIILPAGKEIQMPLSARGVYLERKKAMGNLRIHRDITAMIMEVIVLPEPMKAPLIIW